MVVDPLVANLMTMTVLLMDGIVGSGMVARAAPNLANCRQITWMYCRLVAVIV